MVMIGVQEFHLAAICLYKYNIVQAIGEDDDDEAQVQLSNGTLLLDLPATPGPRYHGGPVTVGQTTMSTW